MTVVDNMRNDFASIEDITKELGINNEAYQKAIVIELKTKERVRRSHQCIPCPNLLYSFPKDLSRIFKKGSITILF